MNKLASIDFETAGLFDDAVILSLGLTISDYEDKDVTFDQLVSKGLFLKFKISEQQEKWGRKLQPSVLAWWKDKTTPQARLDAWGGADRVSLSELPRLMKEYLTSQGVTDFKKIDWYDRNCFDMSKMQHVHEENLKEPLWWDYQNRYEFATALRFLGADRYGNMPADSFPNATYHNPLHDAAMDHLRILNAMHRPV